MRKNITFPNVSNQFLYQLSSVFAAAGDALQVSVIAYTMPNGDV